MTERFEVAVIGSGFAGSLAARILATLGVSVVLVERNTHPRFAIGESSTPLAALSLERIARGYGLEDCHHLATHGRWINRYPALQRGLKRGFTFYRHHPGVPFENQGIASERLLVAASPNDAVADTHWLRADVDHHFVREAVRAGVDYRDQTEVTRVECTDASVNLTTVRNEAQHDIRVGFVIDASGPRGCLATHLPIPSDLARVQTWSSLVFGHFAGVRTFAEVVPGLPVGPYPDDWAAVHHVLDEGWMYSLRFDDGLTSAGFALNQTAHASLDPALLADPPRLWQTMMHRYPTIAAALGDATATAGPWVQPRMQHRLAQAAGPRWALLPHAFAFVDPLFSTGMAWSLRAVERLASMFAERTPSGSPTADALARYDHLLGREADQIDRLVAAADASMSQFDLFAAHAMLYFATVSFAEVAERLTLPGTGPWSGFLGAGSDAEGLFTESLARLQHLAEPSREQRAEFVQWVGDAIRPRNIAGLADPTRHNLYPVDLDVLLERHELLGMSRADLESALPALRGAGESP